MTTPSTSRDGRDGPDAYDTDVLVIGAGRQLTAGVTAAPTSAGQGA